MLELSLSSLSFPSASVSVAESFEGLDVAGGLEVFISVRPILLVPAQYPREREAAIKAA
jgi:hypothetical protein